MDILGFDTFSFVYSGVGTGQLDVSLKIFKTSSLGLTQNTSLLNRESLKKISLICCHKQLKTFELIRPIPEFGIPFRPELLTIPMKMFIIR